MPLLQLPSELLLAIIHEYVAICRRRTQKRLAGRFYTWIKVTHVCQHLRAVAIADPTLWNMVNVVQPDFLQELLVRSQQTPLTYEIGHIAQSDAALQSVGLMLESLDRVAEFKYLYSSSHFGKFPEIGASAPLLRSLTVHNAEQIHPRGATVKAPRFFSDCELPSLEKLDVALLPYSSIQSMFRPTLKSLTISTCTIPGIASVLLDALQDMPLLETLKLHQVLPEHSTTRKEASSPVVSLSHLRYLYLSRCGATECADFLDHLSFPSDTALHLDMRPCGRQLWCSLVIPALSAKFKDRAPVKTAYIHSPWNTDVQVAVWSKEMSMDEFESQGVTPDLCITMYGHHSGTVECDETLVSLTCDLPMSGVKTLCIGELNHYLKRNSSWIAIFTPMTQTETLGVSGSSVEFVSSVFHRPRERKLSSSGGGNVMANLKCLSLRKVTFKEDYEAAVYHYDYIHSLSTCLAIRNERHKKLEVLRIRLAVNLAEEDTHLLESVADRLDWDHEVHIQSLRKKFPDDVFG